MENKKVLFDTSIFIHANYHILTTFVDADKITNQGLADKIAQQIESIAFKKFPGHQIILALDSPDIFRKDFLSSYKSNRTEKKNFDKGEIHNILMDKFYCIEYNHLEADDIAYIYCQKYPETVLVSNDNDYLLMLGGGRKLYKYRQDKFIQLDDKQLLAEQLLKVMDGCDGDCIPKSKLKRIGKSFVSKFIDKYGLNLIQSLMRMKLQGDIGDWNTNYLCAVYDFDTYRSVLPEFDNFYNSL